MALAVSNSSIEIANAALAQIGHKPISDFNQNTIAARTLNTLFEDVLADVIGMYPWRFAQVETAMSQTTDIDVPAGWDSIWAMPANIVWIRSVKVDGSNTDFDVYGRYVATRVAQNTTATVKAVGSAMIDPQYWPGHFRRPFTLKLAAAIAMPITQDERTTAYLEQQAENALARAKSMDAQGRTSPKMDTSGFIRARRGLR